MSATNQVMVPRPESQSEAICKGCGRSFSHRGYVDHLFHSRDCMRVYWREEERMHAYNVRHRSLNRKRERELAKERGATESPYGK